MKFATLALLATVSSVQISTEEAVDMEVEENSLLEIEEEVTGGPCMSSGDSDSLFDIADTEKKGLLEVSQI